MDLDRVQADEEGVCDLLVGMALGDQPENFSLARRQVEGPRGI